jgi:hypothetical protein
MGVTKVFGLDTPRLGIRIMIFARMAPAGRRRVLDSDAVNGWLVGDAGR